MKMMKKIILSKEAIIGMVAGIAVLLIFLTVYMTASNKVSENIKELRVGIVNLDENTSGDTLAQLEKSLPFKVTTYDATDAATKELYARKLEMVIELPVSFSSDLQENKEVAVRYYVNQGQSMTSINMMNASVLNINEVLNQKVHDAKIGLLAGKLQTVFEAKENAGGDVSSQQVAVGIENFVKNIQYQGVALSKIEKDKAKEMSTTLFPTIVLVTICLSGLLFLLLVHNRLLSLRVAYGKWKVWASSHVIFIGYSMVVSLIIIGFAKLFEVPLYASVIDSFLFFGIATYASMCLTQISFLLFGLAGQLVNFLFFAMQVVASGVLITRVLLPVFYQNITAFLPGPSIIDGLFAQIYDGTGLWDDIYRLLLLTFGYLCIAAVILFFQRNTEKTSPVDIVI